MALVPMSTGNQKTNPSTLKYTAIFEAASIQYKTLTKQDLGTHPFAVALENVILEKHNSSDFALGVFRKQAKTFDRFRQGEDKLIKWLTGTVDLVFEISATLGEGILVSPPSLYATSHHIYLFLAILACSDYFYWNRCSPRSKHTPALLWHLSLSYHIQLRRQGMLPPAMERLLTSLSALYIFFDVSITAPRLHLHQK
jgi:hypothetical protein